MNDIGRTPARTELLREGQSKGSLADAAGPSDEKAAWRRNAHPAAPRLPELGSRTELAVDEGVAELLDVASHPAFCVSGYVRVKCVANGGSKEL